METLYLLSPQVSSVESDGKEYQLAVARVCMYVKSVYSAKLPVTENPLPWRSELNARLQVVRADMEMWSSGIYKDLLAVPKQILDKDGRARRYLDDSKKALDILIKKPQDPDAKEDLVEALENMSKVLRDRSLSIRDLVGDLTKFDAKFDQHKGAFQTISSHALQSQGQFKGKIEELSNEIRGLKSQLVGQGIGIAAGALIAGAGIVIGIAAIVMIPATGGISLALLIPAGVALAGGGAIIGLTAKALVDTQNKIQALQAEMGPYARDVVVLLSIVDDFNKLAEENAAARISLTKIRSTWKTMENQVEAAIKDIKNASNSSGEWHKVLESVTSAKENWSTLVALAKSLEIKISVTDREFAIPTDPQKIKQQLESAPPKLAELDLLAA